MNVKDRIKEELSLTQELLLSAQKEARDSRAQSNKTAEEKKQIEAKYTGLMDAHQFMQRELMRVHAPVSAGHKELADNVIRAHNDTCDLLLERMHDVEKERDKLKNELYESEERYRKMELHITRCKCSDIEVVPDSSLEQIQSLMKELAKVREEYARSLNAGYLATEENKDLKKRYDEIGDAFHERANTLRTCMVQLNEAKDESRKLKIRLEQSEEARERFAVRADEHRKEVSDFRSTILILDRERDDAIRKAEATTRWAKNLKKEAFRVEPLEAEIAGLKAEVEGLVLDVGTLERERDRLKAEVKRLKEYSTRSILDRAYPSWYCGF